MQGAPDRVFAPQRGLASIACVLRRCMAITLLNVDCIHWLRTVSKSRGGVMVTVLLLRRTRGRILLRLPPCRFSAVASRGLCIMCTRKDCLRRSGFPITGRYLELHSGRVHQPSEHPFTHLPYGLVLDFDFLWFHPTSVPIGSM
jgi:hypothetical protein